VSAFDEAVAAALATGVPIHKSYIAEVLDAVPGAVLAQLAIERGGLEDDGTWVVPDDPEDYIVHYEDEDRPENAVTLYRLVTP
jgi:hypothetical protein